MLSKEPVYQAIWTNTTDYDEVIISPVMLQDHMPDKVLEALKKVRVSKCNVVVNQTENKTKGKKIKWEIRQQIQSEILCFSMNICLTSCLFYFVTFPDLFLYFVCFTSTAAWLITEIILFVYQTECTMAILVPFPRPVSLPIIRSYWLLLDCSIVGLQLITFKFN